LRLIDECNGLTKYSENIRFSNEKSLLFILLAFNDCYLKDIMF